MSRHGFWTWTEDIQNNAQFGSRPNLSFETFSNTSNKQEASQYRQLEVVGLLQDDFKKAFDLADHDILLHKLHSYAVTNTDQHSSQMVQDLAHGELNIFYYYYLLLFFLFILILFYFILFIFYS